MRRLSREGEPLRYARHPLVYAVEAADDICYEIMDIEDAHKLKILTTDETKALLLQFFTEREQQRAKEVFNIVSDVNEQIAYLRSGAIGALIKACTRAFMEHEAEILDGTFKGSLISHTDSRIQDAYHHCEALSYRKIYHSKDVVDIELAGFKVMSTLLDLMMDAVLSPDKAYSQLLIRRVSEQYDMAAPTLYGKVQAVLDYVSGMTDVFAVDLYRKINGTALPAL